MRGALSDSSNSDRIAMPVVVFRMERTISSEREMRYALRTFLLPFVVWASAILPGQLSASAGDLALSSDFAIRQVREMPCPVTPHWRVDRRDYVAFNAIEWQVGLQMPRAGTPPIFEQVKSGDFVVRFPNDAPVTLHWSKGSHAKSSDFQPCLDSLVSGKRVRLESFGGRSSDRVMPYFNLAGDGGGLIVAIGWTGDWATSFTLLDGSDAVARVHVTAGLQRSHFRLPLGERVRLPSILVMSYRGDYLAGQNQFRQLMLKEFTPREQDALQQYPVAASVHGLLSFNDTNEENLVALAKDVAATKLPLDTFWLDAGWNRDGFPLGQGNPQADPVRFPRGLAPVGAAAKAAPMRFLAWFEPERVMRGTWLDREHPQWLLHPSGTPAELRYQEDDGFRLLDLGNPAARQWAIDSVSRQIAAAGIDIYRQDCNLYPAYFWHTGEDPDCVGLREVRYISGLYAFLDELKRRHPHLIIDNCAAGGRRLDFEMMRRCVVLWRSDSCWDAPTFPRNVQAMSHGLSLWLPLHGLGAAATNTMALRSGMGACASYAINYRDPKNVTALGQHLVWYLPVRRLFAADYYPLTSWSDAADPLLAMQYHNPQTEAGLIQVFSGKVAPPRGTRLKLRGLVPTSSYHFTNWDRPNDGFSVTGNELMLHGLTLPPMNADQAVVLQYAAALRESQK